MRIKATNYGTLTAAPGKGLRTVRQNRSWSESCHQRGPAQHLQPPPNRITTPSWGLGLCNRQNPKMAASQLTGPGHTGQGSLSHPPTLHARDLVGRSTWPSGLSFYSGGAWALKLNSELPSWPPGRHDLCSRSVLTQPCQLQQLAGYGERTTIVKALLPYCLLQKNVLRRH